MTAPAGPGAPATPLTHIRGTAELVAIADLSEEARAVLVPGAALPTQRAFVALLMERGLHRDAVRFIAHILQEKQSIASPWQQNRIPNPGSKNLFLFFG